MADERWCSPNPDGASTLLGGVAVPWWIAGGWAIDLFTGKRNRPHVDLDIGCFRQDLGKLLELFAGWDVRVSQDGVLRPLPAGQLPHSTAHELWLKPADSDCWVFEVLIEERAGTEWVYRRDERIRRPAGDIGIRNHKATPYLRPEIQLLYKSKQPRRDDEEDFRSAWPLLTEDAKRWFRESLSLLSPGHPWLQLREF